MHSSLSEDNGTITQKAGYVSAGFLTDFFSALSKRGIAVTNLIGDLPIIVDERGRVSRAAEWSDFADLLRRLEHEVDGAEGLETIGEMICGMKPAQSIRLLAGLSASPFSLFQAASRWRLRRALPGIQSSTERTGENEIVIRARVFDPLRPCPQLFHIGTGAARALPRILGMPDAVVNPVIGEREAVFEITVPPSRTISARIGRFLQMIFSAGSVLRFLEDQQLELHAKHDALMRAHAELSKTEQRYREMADAAVDVLCEIDEDGQVSYVNAAVNELLGYSPEQVTGSHFRLWIPARYHAVVTERFERLFTESAGQYTIREQLTLHAAGGRRVPVELVARTYCISDRSSEESRTTKPLTTKPLTKEPLTTEPLATSAKNTPANRARGREGAWRFVATLRALREDAPPPPLAVTDAHSFETTAAVPVSEQPAHFTQAVEHALIAAADGRSTSDWVETRKLIDRAQFAAQDQHSLSLRIDTRNAPAEIAGDEELLAACLRGLLRWGIARLGARTGPLAFGRSTPPQKLLLRIETDSETALRLSVGIDWPEGGAQEKVYGRRSRPSQDEAPSALSTCLAEAQDAARALGGHLMPLEDNVMRRGPQNSETVSPLDSAFDPHAAEQTVRIPQPMRHTPTTR